MANYRNDYIARLPWAILFKGCKSPKVYTIEGEEGYWGLSRYGDGETEAYCVRTGKVELFQPLDIHTIYDAVMRQRSRDASIKFESAVYAMRQSQHFDTLPGTNE